MAARGPAKESRLLRVLADGHFRDVPAVCALLHPERWSLHEVERLLEDLVRRGYVTDGPGSGRRGSSADAEYAISPAGMAEVRRRDLRRTG